MAIFNCYVSSPEGSWLVNGWSMSDPVGFLGSIYDEAPRKPPETSRTSKMTWAPGSRLTWIRKKKAQIARKKRWMLSWIVSFYFPRFYLEIDLKCLCLWNHGWSKLEDLKFWYPRSVFQLGPWKQRQPGETIRTRLRQSLLLLSTCMWPLSCSQPYVLVMRMNRINKYQWLDLESGVKPHF